MRGAGGGKRDAGNGKTGERETGEVLPAGAQSGTQAHEHSADILQRWLETCRDLAGQDADPTGKFYLSVQFGQ